MPRVPRVTTHVLLAAARLSSAILEALGRDTNTHGSRLCTVVRRALTRCRLHAFRVFMCVCMWFATRSAAAEAEAARVARRRPDFATYDTAAAWAYLCKRAPQVTRDGKM